MTKTKQPRVLVLGGGFAGIQLAIKLGKHAQVTLVDK